MSWSNTSKNTSSFTNQSKSGQAYDAFILNIDGTYDLLIDSTYKLQIQSASSGTSWSNQTKN